MKTLLVGPNSITAKTSSNLNTIFTVDNCNVVYLADGSYQSWKPGRTLNAFNQLIPGKGYIAIMLQTLDVSLDFISTDDIGGGGGSTIANPVYTLHTNSVTKNLDVVFTETDGTIISTKTVIHSTSGLSGDLTDYLGKKIKFTRSDYNFVFNLVIKSTTLGVISYSTLINSVTDEFEADIPEDAESLSLSIDQKQSPLSAIVYLIPGNMAEIMIFTDTPVDSNLTVSADLMQNDPIAGVSDIDTVSITIPTGQTQATEQVDISSLSDQNYLQVASLSFSNPDYYSTI